MKLLVLLVCVAFSHQEVSKSNQGFSARVYKKTSKLSRNNFLVSPLSVETLLHLTLEGSKNETAEEIRRCLNSSTQNLLRGGTKHTLKIANKIYLANGFSLFPSFKNSARKFGVEYETVEFRPEVVKDINGWVSNQTNHKIQNLLEPSVINFRTKLLLVNVLYFKANWSKPFPIAYTQKLDFHVSSSEVVKVATMVLHEKHFNYYEDKKLGAKFLELPFEGGVASMVVVLPNENNTFCSLESQMKKVLEPHRLTNVLVNVALPKFRIETKINFKQILKRMGVRKMFDRKYADLSGISGKKGDLVVDDVAQKTFIDVSERGVEAAAATYKLMVVPLVAPAEEPKQFIVNRPFIFYIKIEGVVVFVGRVLNPNV